MKITKSLVVMTVLSGFVLSTVVACGVSSPKAGKKTLENLNKANNGKVDGAPAEDGSGQEGGSQDQTSGEDNGTVNTETPAEGSQTTDVGAGTASGSPTVSTDDQDANNTDDKQKANQDNALVVAQKQANVCGVEDLHTDVLNNEALRSVNMPVLLNCSTVTKPASESKLEVSVNEDKTILTTKFDFVGANVELVTSSVVKVQANGVVELETDVVPEQYKIKLGTTEHACAVIHNKDNPEAVKRNMLPFTIEGFDYQFSLISKRSKDDDSSSCLDEEILKEIARELVRVLFPKN